MIRYSILLAMLLFTQMAYCQFFKNVGLRTGISNSYLRWDYRAASVAHEETYRSNKDIGYFVTITSDIMERKYWDLTTSFGIIQKNSKTYAASGFDDVDQKYKTTCVSLFSAFKGKLPIGRNFDLYGLMGPRLDYLISYSDNLTYHDYIYQQVPYLMKNKKDLHKVSYGLTLGAGIQKSFKKIILRMEYLKDVNFNYLINVSGAGNNAYNYSDNAFFFKESFYTSSYNLNVVYRF